MTSHHTTNTSTRSSPDAGLPALHDTIGLQLNYFEQSLLSQELRFKQLADEQEASIKAAAAELKARAAEVGNLLTGKKDVAPKEKLEEFDSQWGVKELQSCSQSPSQQFPRSKSRSPVRYRKECNKQKDHSPKDTTSYRHHRRARDHDFGEYHRHHYGSSYGRARYFSGGRSDANYDRNKGRSTTRRSRSRSPTWRRPVDSRSHSPGSFRSESRDSRCRIPSRISGSHRMSRSPINDYSVSNRTQQGKDINTSKPKVLRRSPSLENCWSHRSAGLQVDPNVNASKNFQSAAGDGKNPVYVTSDCMDSPASSLPKSTSSMDYPTYTYCLPRKEDAGNGHDTIVNSEHGLLNVKEDDLDDSTLHTQQEVFNHEVDAMHLSAPAKFASIYPSPPDPRPSRFQSSERVSKYQPRSTKKTAKHAKQYHHRQGSQKY